MQIRYFTLALTLILYLMFSEIAYCYHEPNRYYYLPVGMYENSAYRNHNTYNTYKERNANNRELIKYFCLYKNPNDEYGYLLERSAIGCVGYKYQDFLGQRERIKCNKQYYDVVRSFKEAREYKD